jgi:putative ribosome biogenesis GTPase RsgA
MSNQKVNKALRARVYRSTGSWYMIKNTAGEFLQARFKGKFKVDAAIKSSNPIAVGDWVSYEELSDEEGIVTITDIEKRNNYNKQRVRYIPSLLSYKPSSNAVWGRGNFGGGSLL